MKRKVYNGKEVKSSGPYSHAVDAGDTIYLSGQTGYNGANYDGEKYSIKKQTELSFKHLEDVMSQAGVSYDDVVKVNVFLTSMKYFTEMNAIYETHFNAPFPARTCVAVYELHLGADVEIKFIIKRK